MPSQRRALGNAGFAVLGFALVCGLLNATLPFGRPPRSMTPKIAAATAPIAPNKISHIAPTLQVRGSELK